MGLLNMLSYIAQKHLTVDNTVPVKKTDTPLGLHQGSIVTMPDIELALAQVDGSLIKPVSGNQIVKAVGYYRLFNRTVYHAYLDDGSNYLQIVTDAANNVTEVKIWTSYAEINPQSEQDWEFWLGSWQKNEQGNYIRDVNGIAIRKEFGLIGWTQFQVGGPPASVYNRSWLPSSTGIDPVKFIENIIDSQGNCSVISHEAVEYNRQLTEAADSTVESLLASVSQTESEASINIFVGIAVDYTNLKIIAA